MMPPIATNTMPPKIVEEAVDEIVEAVEDTEDWKDGELWTTVAIDGKAIGDDGCLAMDGMGCSKKRED